MLMVSVQHYPQCNQGKLPLYNWFSVLNEDSTTTGTAQKAFQGISWRLQADNMQASPEG